METVDKTNMISLVEALRAVPEHRRKNLSHPLPSLLALATCAMLCGARGLSSIAQWGRDHFSSLGPLLGFPKDRLKTTPCTATFHYVFKGLNLDAFEKALLSWLLPRCPDVLARALAFDGKTLRGVTGHLVPGVHLMAAFSHKLGIVVAQHNTGEKGHELTGFRVLLEKMDLLGKIVTGDALLTQRDVCETITEKKKQTTTSW